MSEQESDIQNDVDEDMDQLSAAAENQEVEQAVVQLEAKLQESEAKAKENWDLLLRSKAELDNIQKRSQRDLENAHKYAIERIAQEMLAVVDSMELGLSAASDEAVSISRIIEGNELTLKMLLQGLEKFGIAPVNPLNDKFNPDLHQAMSMQETDEHPPGMVLSVMQKGYLLKDRLLRPALVVVAKETAKQNDSSKANSDSD